MYWILLWDTHLSALRSMRLVPGCFCIHFASQRIFASHDFNGLHGSDSEVDMILTRYECTNDTLESSWHVGTVL